jgi:hypothetical protein
MESKKNVLTFSKMPFFYYLCPSFINEHEKIGIFMAHTPVDTLCMQG